MLTQGREWCAPIPKVKGAPTARTLYTHSKPQTLNLNRRNTSAESCTEQDLDQALRLDHESSIFTAQGL